MSHISDKSEQLERVSYCEVDIRAANKTANLRKYKSGKPK